MNALLERPDTVVPTDSDTKLAEQASRTLAKSHAERQLRVRLDNGTELALPQSATRLILHLLTEMAQGNAVTLIPIHAELTTQEAADFLNVSRPYLIKLLEGSRIPFHKTGTHRRVRFSDLTEFRARQEKQRENALSELAKQAQELKLGY